MSDLLTFSCHITIR